MTIIDEADCERPGVCMDNLIKITTSTPRNGISAAVKVGCVNVQLIKNKTALIHEVIESHNLNMFLAVETWHETAGSLSLSRAIPSGFSVIDEPRPIPADVGDEFVNHSGLALLYRNNICVVKKDLKAKVTNFEYLCGYITVANRQSVIFGVYRPGSEMVTSEFFSKFTRVLDVLSTYRCSIILCVNFNIHIDDESGANDKKFLRLLRSSMCTQHVSEPTHTVGHTLNLVITRDDEPVSNVHVGDQISDHALMSFAMVFEIMPLRYITKEVRSWQKFNNDAFEDDLSRSAIFNLTADYKSLDLDEMVELYDKILSSLLDEHCPSRKIQIRNNVSSPWFDSDCRAKRRYVRMFERRYRRRLRFIV